MMHRHDTTQPLVSRRSLSRPKPADSGGGCNVAGRLQPRQCGASGRRNHETDRSIITGVSQGTGRRDHRVGAGPSGPIAWRHGAEQHRHHADHSRRQLSGPVDARLRHVAGLRADQRRGDTAAIAVDRPVPERRERAAVAQRRDHSAVRHRGSRQPGRRGGVLSGHVFLGRRPRGAALGAVATDRRSFLLHPHRLRALARHRRCQVPRRVDRRTAACSTAWSERFIRRLPIPRLAPR